MVSVLKPFSLSRILVDNKKSQIGGNLAFIGMGFECTVLRTSLKPFFNGPPSLKNDFARYYWTMSMDHLFMISNSFLCILQYEYSKHKTNMAAS